MDIPWQKLRYFVDSGVDCLARRHFECPNCGQDRRIVVDRKYLVTQLNRCQGCWLLYRTPADTQASNARHYGAAGSYQEAVPTRLPGPEELEALVARNFAGTSYDYAAVVRTLQALGLPKGARVFDFGCAWGYGSFQLRQAGLDVLSYEISAPRLAYGRERLGLRTLTDFDAIDARHPEAHSFDCFFSSHVLEHVPGPSRVFERARHLLRPGGLFVALTPNGSEAHRAANPNWSLMWGRDHPNYVDEVFLSRHFSNEPRLFTSRQMETAEGCPLLDASEAARARAHLGGGHGTQILGSLERGELLFATRIGGASHPGPHHPAEEPS